MNFEEYISVPLREYEKLLERDRWLCALEAAGIDNTEAYSFAFEILEEWDGEQD